MGAFGRRDRLATDTLFGAARANLSQGRIDQAERLYRQVLERAASHAGALHHLGLIHVYRGETGHALDLLEKSVSGDPGSVEALYDLGAALQASGRPEAAIARYRQALTLQADHLPSLLNLGAACRTLLRLEEAIACYARAAAIQPQDATAFYRLGNALQLQGRHAEALEPYCQALALRPDYPEVLRDLGFAYEALGRGAEAVACYRRAVALNPSDAVAHSNLGTALKSQGEMEEAILAYREALLLRPDFAEAHYNLGTALQATNRYEAAIDCYVRATALKPSYAEAHWNEALSRLTIGDFALGWEKFEWRWLNPALGLRKRDFAVPLWLGQEDPAGRTILLHADQGLGDALLFSRFVPVVAALGARVVLEVQRPLLKLLAGLDGVAAVVAQGAALPEIDCHCPLSSLPLACRTSWEAISPAPSLTLDPAVAARWRRRLGETDRPRIGLAWTGNPANSLDAARSMPARFLAPLLDLPGYAWVGLQKPLRAEDASILGDHPALGLGTEFGDFADTAAAIMELDLVIAVDTSVAHLAGTLGKPVWVLLAHAADWRWHAGRADSPWYGSARLFRQPAAGDWSAVIDRVVMALKAGAGP